jgi:Dynamin family
MIPPLIHTLQDYGAWRRRVTEQVQDFRRWLQEHDLADSHVELRINQIVDRLAEDRLTIAFVAEYSRGKSELINAIFFADYGRRLLPTSAGRTTMCPTELKWNPEQPACLQLLPIETRGAKGSVSDFKKIPDEWLTFPLDISAPDSLVRTLQRIRDTKRIALGEAQSYGLFVQGAPEEITANGDKSIVEVPRWRHAVINFPHPLLAQGLVILDTPGLNAIGSEPELTLDLLPNAHAVLFVLGLDTGVSKSDMAMWRNYIQGPEGRNMCRFAVLNKIDALWDDIRTDEQIEAEILQQVISCANQLDIDAANIFPVSAQRGLLAKIKGDDPLLNRSRLPQLEQALSTNLAPRRRQIMRESTQNDLDGLFARTQSLLEERIRGHDDQRSELLTLRGKNMSIVAQMVSNAQTEKSRFERGMAKFQALRSVHAKHANAVFAQLGLDALNEDARVTMLEVRKSRFTSGVRSAMAGYFDRCRTRMKNVGSQIAEIHQMMEAMYQRYESEQGLKLGAPPAFSLDRYVKEFQRVEGLYQKHFDTLFAMLTTEAMTLLQRFLDTIATQIRRVFTHASREAEQWFRELIAPIELQIRERQQQLRRRLASIKQVHGATDALEERLRDLEQAAGRQRAHVDEMQRLALELHSTLTLEDHDLAAAA